MSNAVSMPRSVGFVRAWVRLYTTGLPPDLRDIRREEIDADLWDQTQEAAMLGRPPSEVRSQVLLRLLLGMPADVSWRVAKIGAHQRGESATERGRVMQAIRTSDNGTRAAMLLTVVLLPFAAIFTVGNAWNWFFAIFLALVNLGIAASPLLVIGGLRLRKRSPALGTVSVAVVALGGTAGVVLFWGSIVSPWWEF